MRRVTLIDLVTLVVISAAFLFLFRGVPPPDPYYFDEADYVTAGSRGVVANVLERPSMSIVTFLETGLHRGMQASRRTSLSELVRGSKDITFYRHYHGPIYFYWLALVGPLVDFDEYGLRFSGFVFHILTFAAIYLGVALLTGSRIGALLASFLFLFGQSNISTDAQITPHIPYVFFTVVTLLLFAGYLQTGTRRLWYATICAFVGAFCSIDYAILLPITFAICFFVFRNRIPEKSVLIRSGLLFLGLLLILWPIGLVELSAIKGYFYIAYLASQRKGSYGDDGPLAVWWQRISAAPVEYGLDLLVFVLVILAWRQESLRRYRMVILPCLTYALLMLSTTLKNTSINPTYVSSILPPFAVIGGVVLETLTRRVPTMARMAAASVMLIAIAWGGYMVVLRQENRPPVNRERSILAMVRDSQLEYGKLLVPYDILPTMSYYFPGLELHPYLLTDDDAVILEKAKEFGIQGLLYTNHPDDSFPEKLKQIFHVEEKLSPGAASTTLFRLEGRV